MPSRPSPPQLRYEQLVVDFANELREQPPNWERLEHLHRELARLEKILFGTGEDLW